MIAQEIIRSSKMPETFEMLFKNLDLSYKAF